MHAEHSGGASYHPSLPHLQYYTNTHESLSVDTCDAATLDQPVLAARHERHTVARQRLLSSIIGIIQRTTKKYNAMCSLRR